MSYIGLYCWFECVKIRTQCKIYYSEFLQFLVTAVTFNYIDMTLIFLNIFSGFCGVVIKLYTFSITMLVKTSNLWGTSGLSSKDSLISHTGLCLWTVWSTQHRLHTYIKGEKCVKGKHGPRANSPGRSSKVERLFTQKSGKRTDIHKLSRQKDEALCFFTAIIKIGPQSD